MSLGAGVLSHNGETNGRARWLYLLPPLVFTAVVYFPVTQNYFFADDFINLYQIANDPLPQYLVTPNGGHIHLTRNTIFYLMERLFGTHPEPYYWTEFLTHLVSVWLLFRVIEVLTRSPRLACFGAALWGISPLNEGALGWYSVYGHALVGLVLLVILYQASSAAAAARAPSPRTLWLWYALALIAATSFGTGVGIALVLPFALALWLQPEGRFAWLRRPPLISLVVIVPALYAAVMRTYETLSGLSSHIDMPVTSLPDPTAVPVFTAHLIAFGFTRLVMGAYFAPWVTVGVWYGVLACVALALVGVLRRSTARVRRQFAACSLLLLGCYGMVALGRSFLMVRWPMSIFILQARYHYVGQLIMTIMLCLLLNEIAPAVPARVRLLALVAWYSVAVFVSARFGTAIDNHLQARQQTEDALAGIQAAIEAQPRGHAVYIANTRFKHLPLPPLMFPGWVGVFMIFYPDDSVDGRRVYFVESKSDVVNALQHGMRTRTLIVSAPPPGDA